MKVAPQLQSGPLAKEINSRAMEIVRTQRQEDGSRYNGPSATRRAQIEILAKRFKVTDAMMAEVVDAYISGELR